MEFGLHYSVALCTCNGDKFIEDQLQSIADQSWQPREVVVFDDASTDQTRKLVNVFSKSQQFEIRLIKNQTPLGIAKNFEKAISCCTSEIIFLSDQDDVWMPQKAQKYMELFLVDKNLVLISSNSAIVDESLNHTGKDLWAAYHIPGKMIEDLKLSSAGFNHFLRRNSFLGHSIAIRASTRDIVLPIPTYQYDFWITLASSACGNSLLIPECLTMYRRHGAQFSTGSSGENYIAMAKQTVSMNHFDGEIDKLNALRTRITTNNKNRSNRNHDATTLIDQKIWYLQKRKHMKHEGIWRVMTIGSLLFGGFYHKLGRGFLTAARDLLS